MEARLNIAFVNPPSPIPGAIWIRDINRSGRISREHTIWPQTSLAMLAAVFPEDNVKIYDCIAEEIGYKELYDQLQEFNPQWVIFNPVSSSFPHDMIVAMHGKALGAKTVAISPHTKVLKEESLKRYPSLDYTIDYHSGGPEYEWQLWSLIKGVPLNGQRFEDLPPARQDLLPIHRYNLPLIGNGYTFIIISRGCAWACIYCRATVQNERRPRFRPVENVIEEIKKYKLKNIALHADTATMNKKWIYEFCSQLKQLPFKVRIVTNSRVDTVDLAMLKEMKSAGFWMICYGIESGDDRVLAMNKKEATVSHARHAVQWAKQAKLRVWGYFMLGMYGDTPASMRRTLDLAKALPCDLVNFALAAPYPGTEWGRIAETEGWLASSRWEDYDQNDSAIVDQPDCPHEEVLAYQRRAYQEWYGSWRGVKFALQAWRPQYARFFWHVLKAHLA